MSCFRRFFPYSPESRRKEKEEDDIKGRKEQDVPYRTMIFLSCAAVLTGGLIMAR
jgi:hypothetical protein